MDDKEKIIENLALIKDGITPENKQNISSTLAVYINNLILHDFNLLVQLLYTVDVSEKKLKDLLKQHQKTDAAVIIADLLIERQLEKQKHKKNSPKGNIDENEKW